MNIAQNTNNSNLLGSGQRPNLMGTDPATSGSRTARVDNWFNNAAWTAAPAFTYGNAPRIDTRVRSSINALNNPDLQSPNTAFGNTNFGRITQVGGFPRMLQLMVRFGF